MIYVGNVIDQFSDVPLYEQVAGVLRARIQNGELAHLDPLPSEKVVQQEFGVGRDTARHAIQVLREEGLVFTVPQRGTFVGPRP